MGAFGIQAFCPSTSANDWHGFAYATARTSGVVFEVTPTASLNGTGPLLVRGNRDVIVGRGTSGAELATTATGGFLCIPSCNGVPTGVPANAGSSLVQLVYDRANEDLYVYNGAWVKAAFA